MIENDIIYVKDLKVGDLLHWGTETYRGIYLLLSIDKLEATGKVYPRFFDVTRYRVYNHDIEDDDFFVYCVKLNKTPEICEQKIKIRKK
jgi:hypothetical protein